MRVLLTPTHGAAVYGCQSKKKMQDKKPVVWVSPQWPDLVWAEDGFSEIQIEGWAPLYAAKTPLTEQEIHSLCGTAERDEMMRHMAIYIARAIERAHGIGQ